MRCWQRCSGAFEARREIRAVRIEPALFDYLLAIVRRTRDWPAIALGASPRASAGLMLDLPQRLSPGWQPLVTITGNVKLYDEHARERKAVGAARRPD